MFCGNCGQFNPDRSIFCSNCGASLQPPASAPVPEQPPKGKPVKLIAAVIGGAAILILVIVLLLLGFGNPETKPIDTYLKGVNNLDIKTMYSVFPKSLLEDFDLDEDAIEDLKNNLIDCLEDADIEKFKISHEIRKVEDLKRSQLRDLQEQYDRFDLDVTEAKNVKTKIIMEVDGETDKETVEVTVVKIGGKWYLDFFTAYKISASIPNNFSFN